MFVRVRNFGAAHSDRFPKDTPAAAAFATIGVVVDTVNQHAATKYSSRPAASGGPSTETASYRAMVNVLRTIARTARAVDMDTPGVADRFRLPHGKGRQATVNAARAFALDVQPFVSQFITHGMRADFVAELTASIAQFEQALHQREADRERNASARASMQDAVETGMEAIRRLDAVVKNVLADDKSAIAAWKVARRIDRRGGRRSDGEPVPQRPPQTAEEATPVNTATDAAPGPKVAA